MVSAGRIAALILAWSLNAGPPAFAQAADLRYSASQLNCARFLETGESDITAESGGRTRVQTSGRTGVWQFRATPRVDAVALEGWLDSLALWRKSPETTIRPDTDGLIGGRYHAVLTSTGDYQSAAAPFVPEEVAEVADMASALSDFFPPLPAARLRPGQAWSDSAGLTIRRMGDSGMSGVPLYRFELQSQRTARKAAVPGDTTSLRLRQVTREEGTFVWHPLLGFLRRERRIVVETSVPAGRLVRQAVRSKIEQRITVSRDLNVPPESPGPCR